MAFDKETFLNKLETWGENHVRELIATGAMSDPKKVALANEFLRRRGQERSERKDSSKQTIQIVAAIAAIIAAIAATIGATASIMQLLAD